MPAGSAATRPAGLSKPAGIAARYTPHTASDLPALPALPRTDSQMPPRVARRGHPPRTVREIGRSRIPVAESGEPESSEKTGRLPDAKANRLSRDRESTWSDPVRSA